jgi:hypothetical protein
LREIAAPTIRHITAPERILRSVPACTDNGFFSAGLCGKFFGTEDNVQFFLKEFKKALSAEGYSI